MEHFARLFPDRAEGLTATDLAAAVPGEPPADRPFVLANMIATADGRATIAGRTATMANRADYELFHALRARVDAVMVGAETVRVESYGRMIVSEEARAAREREGMPGDGMAVLVREIFHFSNSNAVFAGAGTRHSKRQPHSLLGKSTGLFQFRRILWVDHTQDMEIPISDMTNYCCGKREINEAAPGFGNALSEPGDRNAHVGREHFSSRPQSARCEIGVMPRAP